MGRFKVCDNIEVPWRGRMRGRGEIVEGDVPDHWVERGFVVDLDALTTFPIKDYDTLGWREIVELVKGLSPQEAACVEAYEESLSRPRKSIIKAAKAAQSEGV